MKKIYTSYAAGTRSKDLVNNLLLLLTPWRWGDNSTIDQIKQWATGATGSKNVYTFNYARSAMYAFFKALEPQKGDEAIFQSFTCVAAINPALWAGLTVKMADVDKDTLSIDLKSLRSMISDKTKVIVLQHSFGLDVDMAPIRELANENGIVILEDRAQSMGSHAQYVGDGVVFSFGRDKMIGGVNGGALVVQNDSLNDEVQAVYNNVPRASLWWTFKEILFLPLWSLIKVLFVLPPLAKGVHWILSKSGLLARATTEHEKRLEKPGHVPSRMPGALAVIANSQLSDMEEIAAHRKEIGKYYYGALKGCNKVTLFKGSDKELLRFPLLIDNPEDISAKMLSKGIQLGDWYSQPVGPGEVDMSLFPYDSVSCPHTEGVIKNMLNLPMHSNISMEDAKRIVKELKTLIDC